MLGDAEDTGEAQAHTTNDGVPALAKHGKSSYLRACGTVQDRLKLPQELVFVENANVRFLMNLNVYGRQCF